jgi:predicted alpha/beta-fold hydrolase
MPIEESDFQAPWWLKSPHAQTLWSTFFKKRPALPLIKQRIELADGDFIDLAMTSAKNKPLVLIMHGLEGSLDSHYAKPLMQKLDTAGYVAIFMHFRGCSDEVNRLDRSYHSGDTDDLNQVIDAIQTQFQQPLFAIIGFSLGGNVLLKWLGENGINAKTQTAIAVSVPFQLAHAGDRLEKSFSRVYQKHLISRCQQKYQDKFSHKPSPLDINIDELNTFYRFDDQVTAPLHGFKGADEYYTQCSSRQFLKDIQKPTLIIHAEDDPFMWKHTVPEEQELSKSIQLELSEHGGHVGFITGKSPFHPEYWVDQRIIKWLDANKSLA